MKRIMCVVSYDGTNYAGYQIQINGIAVQAKIQDALKLMHKGTEVRIISSGRTDAGVHAVGQVFHFDTYLSIPPDNWKRALNTLLPDDIHINSVKETDSNFHARYDAVSKEYRYFVLNSAEPDLFRRNHILHVKDKLDVRAMQEACQWIEGEHDFSAFCSAKTDLKGSKIRTVHHVTCEQKGDQITFIFRGSGFLYNMVRILVGTLIEIGKGIYQAEDIKEMIESKSREKSGITAPPNGLYLWKVKYSE